MARLRKRESTQRSGPDLKGFGPFFQAGLTRPAGARASCTFASDFTISYFLMSEVQSGQSSFALLRLLLRGLSSSCPVGHSPRSELTANW